jgi:hypothetical protein
MIAESWVIVFLVMCVAYLPLQLMATPMRSLQRPENAGKVGYCGFARGY